MPCCAASGSAGRINPWSVWIRSWEVSKIGRKKATLLCPRHGFFFGMVFCGFLWIFYGASFFSGVEGNNWEAPVQTCDRFALGHSLDLRTGIPRFRPGSSAKRSAKPKSTNSFRHTTSAHGFAHRLHAVTCCYMLLISCLMLSEAILISRTWGHLEASSNSIYVCFRFCQSSPKTFDRYKMASGGGLWKIQRFAKNLVGLKTNLKHIEIDWLGLCQYLVTLPKRLEYDCRGIKVFLGSTASIEEKPV